MRLAQALAPSFGTSVIFIVITTYSQQALAHCMAMVGQHGIAVQLHADPLLIVYLGIDRPLPLLRLMSPSLPL
jgi:hypothetical protein